MFKIPAWGPKKLRSIHKAIADEINKIQPIKGLGIDIDQKPDGRQISTTKTVGGLASGEGDNRTATSGGGGTSTIIATEFVTVSNFDDDNTENLLYSHGIGAGRLASNGDCIRAIYGLHVQGGAAGFILRFGNGDLADSVIADGNNIDLEQTVEVKIEALLMRTSSTSYRRITSILLSGSSYDDLNQLIRTDAGGLFPDGGADLSIDRFLTLWGNGESVGQVKAYTALIEYIAS